MKNVIIDDNNNQAYLEAQKKQLLFSKITAFACCGILAFQIIGAVLIIPALRSTLKEVDTSLEEMNDTLLPVADGIDIEELNEAITNLNSAIEPLTKMIEGLNRFSFN